MKASSTLFLLLILGFVKRGITEDFKAISSKLIDDNTSEFRQKIKQFCERNSSPLSIKIFEKAENQLKKRVQLNLEKTFANMIQKKFIFQKYFNDFCDIDYFVNNYLIAAKPCLIEKTIYYHSEELSNSIDERKILTSPKIHELIDSICHEMKIALKDMIDTRCFTENLLEIENCFIKNNYFRNYVWLLTNFNLTEVSPRDFPYYVMTNAQPSFVTDLKELIEFRNCLVSTLKTCKYSSLGYNIESSFFPALETLKTLID